MGWVQFFLAESQSRLYPHMRAKFGCDPTAGSKKLPFNFISRYFVVVIFLLLIFSNYFTKSLNVTRGKADRKYCWKVLFIPNKNGFNVLDFTFNFVYEPL